MTKVNYSFEEREKILEEMAAQFKEEEREYDLDKLPQPTNPLTLQGVDLSRKRMAQIDIHPISKSVLCGTIFGDSSFGIDKGYANARVQNRHSSRQREWFFWKWFVALAEFCNDTSSMQFQNPDGKQLKSKPKEGEILGKLKITSLVDERLTALMPLLKPNGFKEIQRSWLNHMNQYFLMTLWLDDGSLMTSTDGVFCCESLREEQQNILAQYLKTVWDVEVVAKPASETAEKKAVRIQAGIPAPKRLHFKHQTDLKKFLLIIAPFVPVQSMLYKLYYCPSNNMLELQRWASELESKVNPKFKDLVNTYYSKIMNQAK